MPICKTCQRERRPSQMAAGGNCTSCHTIKARQNTINVYKEYQKQWYLKNKEVRQAYNKQWRLDNRVYASEHHRNWKHKKYHTDPIFRANIIAQNIAQSERLLNRQPYKNLPREKERIELIYFVASRITELSGIKHHVDHIVPIKGMNVSGLHVACNLRVITASKNMSKGNSYG
jgi:hypothetical protein